MSKLILKKCKCGKTISKDMGDIEKGICFTCIDNQVSEATRKRNLSEYQSNVKKKTTKPKRIDASLVKLAKLGE